MAKIKSATEIASKWARVTPGRQEDYQAGVSDSAVDWAGPAAAAEESYNAGVQEAISRNAFGRGVRDAGNEKWQRAAADKGAARWGPGVRAGQGAYERGFEPFREVIANTTLPPRAPRGDPRNLERVAAIANALSQKRRGS